MDDQLEAITSIIQKYNVAKEITVDGYRATHLPLSYEACLECAKLIRDGHKYYKDGSKIGIMNADKALRDLRLIKEHFKKSDELFDGLPLTIKMPFNNLEIKEKIGKKNDPLSIVSYFKNMIADFNEVYDLLKLNAQEDVFKKSKIKTEILAVMNGALLVWRLHLNRKTPKYINTGKSNDDLTNYLFEIITVFVNIKMERIDPVTNKKKTKDKSDIIDHYYRQYHRWKKGKL
jgi:hypothetical protein